MIKTNSFQNYNEAMENACAERKTVFFGTLSIAFNNFKKISCVLLPLKSEISTAYEAIAVAKNSQYRQILNHRYVCFIVVQVQFSAPRWAPFLI